MQDFATRRFRTASAHYLAGRIPYAPRLIHRVAERVNLQPGDRVMDLGCGPGQLARAFAPLCREVVALDPEPEMLRIARDASAAFPNIAWHQAASTDLSPAFGRFRLVCIGRAFHWMDRPDTLRRLDALVEPGGAIALFTDRHSDTRENAWYRAYRTLVREWGGGDSAGARTRSPDWDWHEAVLLDSPFAEVEEIAVYERRPVTVDTLIERALSMSSTSRARLGDRALEMVAAIRATLPPPPLTELVASVALLAFRLAKASAPAPG